MPGIEEETVLLGQHDSDIVEQITGEVEHAPADPALGMQMRTRPGDQVVGGGAVTDVQMLHHAQLRQRLQGPVDARPVHRTVDSSDRRDHVLGTEVPSAPGQGRQHHPARPGHPLPAGPEPRPDLSHQPLRVRRSFGNRRTDPVVRARTLRRVTSTGGISDRDMPLCWWVHRASVHAPGLGPLDRVSGPAAATSDGASYLMAPPA